MAGPYQATRRYTLDRFETETSFLRSRKAHNHSGITIQFPGLFAETGSLVTASSSGESCKPSVPRRIVHGAPSNQRPEPAVTVLKTFAVLRERSAWLL